jgi:hypothetical protein
MFDPILDFDPFKNNRVSGLIYRFEWITGNVQLIFDTDVEAECWWKKQIKRLFIPEQEVLL